MSQQQAVYIVASKRSPFLKSRGVPGFFSASDMALWAGRSLLLEQSFSAEAIDEVVLGCMMPSENEANIARVVALRLGCGDHVPAFTVQRNCASGMQALDSAFKDIQSGRANLVLAGGTEAMSRSPLLFRPNAVRWFSRLAKAKGSMQKLQQLVKWRPQYFSPIIALLKGLTDPLVGMTMPQTAEQLAYDFSINRIQMDAFAWQSHQRAFAANKNGYFGGRIDLVGDKGQLFTSDDGVRGDATLEKMASLRSITDKRFGMISAGNSSQVTDGASLLLLASEAALLQYDLVPMARIVDCQWAALNPEVMGLGPAMALVPLLQKHNISCEAIDYWEINEAFAAQVLACTAALRSDSFCQQHLGLAQAFGDIPAERLNIDGGAIALGHPVGASGARIVSRLTSILQREQAHRGVASICIGGGQGGAMLIERVR